MSEISGLGRLREEDSKFKGLYTEMVVSMKWLLLILLTTIIKYFSMIAR